jgi:uncharacterized protein
VHHQHYNVYWRTGPPPPPPPAFAAWHTFDEGSGTTAGDSSGSGKPAQLLGGASWTAGRIAGAVALDGADGSYVALAKGARDGATTYSVATWVRLDAAATWSRIFDLGNADPYLKGAVDDLRLYGRALSAAEVADLARG